MAVWKYPNWVPNTPWMSPLPPALSSISLPKNWSFDSFEFYDNTFGELFSPYRRTASPNGSDWESEAYGLTATINTQGYWWNNLGLFPNKRSLFLNRCALFINKGSLSAPEKKFFRFYPPFLPFSLGIPLFTGVHGREGKQMSLPLPSLFRVRSLTFWKQGTLNGRETGGKTNIPPVREPQ